MVDNEGRRVMAMLLRGYDMLKKRREEALRFTEPDLLSMSNSTESVAEQYAEIILTLETIRINDYDALAALGLVVYDALLTFDREVEAIWSRKMTGASVLFVINRYMAILCIALVVAENSITEQLHLRCTVANRMYEATYVVLSIVFALFSALRIYALWNRNILLSAAIFLLDLVPVGTNLSLFPILTPVAIPAPYSECISSNPRPASLDLTLVRLTRSCVIAADLLVIILIWVKTFKVSKQARDLNIKTSLTTLFLRDGSIYFLVLLMVNIAQMLVYEVAGVAYISIFIPATTAVLISRFLLNLRQASHAQAGGGSKDLSEFSAPVFNLNVVETIVGNMGQPLDHGFDLDLNDPEGEVESTDVPESEDTGASGGGTSSQGGV